MQSKDIFKVLGYGIFFFFFFLGGGGGAANLTIIILSYLQETAKLGQMAVPPSWIIIRPSKL